MGCLVSAETVVLAGRGFNERLMTSECVIAGLVMDDDSGAWVLDLENPVYTGPCKIRFNSTVTSQVDGQSQVRIEQNAILSLPVAGSESVAPQQMCQVTFNALDDGLVGKEFRITGDHTQTAATARRFPVELVSGG